MYRNTNISVRDLTPNTYIWPSSGVTEDAQEIFCKQSGTITIFPFIGDMFTWNAQTGDRIRIIPKKLIINSGEFLTFLSFFKNGTQNDVQIVYYMVDENSNSFVDEHGNNFTLK